MVKKNGFVKSWYEDGKSQSLSFYESGKLDGVFKAWYPNGQLLEEITYKSGKMYASKSWYENGNLKKEKKSSNGLDHRCNTTVNGFTRCEYAVAGDGFVKERYSNGRMIEEENYKSGCLDGPRKKWYEDGKWEKKTAIGKNGIQTDVCLRKKIIKMEYVMVFGNRGTQMEN